MPIQRLVEGVHHFQTEAFRSQKDLFFQLAKGQRPETLFITCSDSRINPNLITHTEPGDLFVLRNAGNLVPPYGTSIGGEAPTIEFAVIGLGVTDIVVCGHSHCGAMKGLLHPEQLVDLPTMAAWLEHAEGTRRVILDLYKHCSPEELLIATTQENVLLQLEHLRTHPAVAAGLDAGRLKLHGWIYDIPSGQVYAYDPEMQQFVEIEHFADSRFQRPERLANVDSGDGLFDSQFQKR